MHDWSVTDWYSEINSNTTTVANNNRQ